MSALNRLIELSGQKRKTALSYKRHGNDVSERRVVEAYNLTNGKGDLLVRCFQVEPDEGWRFFSISRIESVDDAGDSFVPRVPLSLASIEIDPRMQESFSRGPTTPEKQYEALIVDAMTDGVVTEEEFGAIAKFVADSNLSDEDRMLVHAKLMHECLGAIIEDNAVEPAERELITFLHKTLARLGWGVIG